MIKMIKIARTVSVLGFVLIMIAVSRYLYLLTGDSQGFSQRGNYVLWLTVGAVVIACIVAGLLFYFFLSHDTARRSKTVNAPVQPASPSNGSTLPHSAPTANTFDVIAWERLNPWLIEGQADDRMPMVGSKGDSNGSPSAYRSTTRQARQRMYKKWSQARHD